jgi:hypothetical protein
MNREVDKLVGATIFYVLAWVLNICVLMFGWGLAPVSWPWIIIGGVIGNFMVAIMGKAFQ